METKGLLKALANGVSVIPVGSTVSVKGVSSNILYRVVTVLVFENKKINYNLVPLEKGYSPVVVDEANVVLIKKVSKGIENIIEEETAAYTKYEMPAVTLHKRLDGIDHKLTELEIYSMQLSDSTRARYNWIRDWNSDMPEDFDREEVPHLDIVQVISNGYVGDKFLIAGEYYVSIRFPYTNEIKILARDLKLKPFRKRIINTLLYGRDHISNFLELESIDMFEKRVKEYIAYLYKDEYYGILVRGEYPYYDVLR